MAHPRAPSANLCDRPLTQLPKSLRNLPEVSGGRLGEKQTIRGPVTIRRVDALSRLFLAMGPDSPRRRTHTLWGPIPLGGQESAQRCDPDGSPYRWQVLTHGTTPRVTSIPPAWELEVRSKLSGPSSC